MPLSRDVLRFRPYGTADDVTRYERLFCTIAYRAYDTILAIVKLLKHREAYPMDISTGNLLIAGFSPEQLKQGDFHGLAVTWIDLEEHTSSVGFRGEIESADRDGYPQ